MVERTNSWNNAHKKLVWCTERQGRVIDFWITFSEEVSSYVGSSDGAGLTTAGRADLAADRSLFAEPRKPTTTQFLPG